MVAPLFATAQQKPAEQQEQAPPEEDEAEKPPQYSFNPLQADKDVRIGNYYFHKGNYRAATQRFREATKWNANLAEAYVRLGEAEEKQRDWSAAREAYEKFVELAADDKRVPEIRKKLEKLPKGKAKVPEAVNIRPRLLRRVNFGAGEERGAYGAVRVSHADTAAGGQHLSIREPYARLLTWLEEATGLRPLVGGRIVDHGGRAAAIATTASCKEHPPRTKPYQRA
jgi:tetratricopeptide (TPR) repeat protein